MTPSSGRWPWRRRVLPPQLVAVLDKEEHVQVLADCADGKMLAASRFGLWVIDDDKASRLGVKAVVNKPFRLDALSGTVCEILANSRAERQPAPPT